MVRGVHVASHNIMHAVNIDELVQRYRQMATNGILDVLCIQENDRIDDGISAAQHIAEGLGEDYKAFEGDGKNLSPAIIYNASKLNFVSAFYAKFPPTERSPIVRKLFDIEDRSFMYYGLAGCTFTMESSEQMFAVVSFHITAFDKRKIKFAQIEEVARVARETCLSDTSIIMCGDTNLFASRKRAQRRLITKALDILGLDEDIYSRPTYHFSRMGEDLNFVQDMPRYLDNIGIRFSLRYDVVAGDLPRIDYEHIVTPESDHDIIRARFKV